MTWLLAALIALAGAAAPQGTVPKVHIIEPTADAPVTGSIVLRASVEPASVSVRHVTFFADSRMVCRMEQPPFQCPWNAGAAISEHSIRAEALLANGTRIATNIRTKGIVDPYNDYVDRVMVTVSVTNADGRFVRGLQPELFKVFEDNVRQKTDFFRAEDTSLELAVGIDISQSMTAAIEDVKTNVQRFLSALRPADLSTVGAFNEKYYVVAPPSVDREAQLKKVGQLAAWGTTSLYDMILRLFDQLSGKAGRHALVIFTDGEDTSSRVRQDAVERRVERNDAVLYIIGQGKVLESAPLRSLCERLAQKSGGRAFFPKGATALAAAFDAITEELANQYFLTYDPKVVKRDDRFRKLRVEVGGGYNVRHAEGYRLRNPSK